MKHKWGTKDWFEYMFDCGEGDRWGHTWRGSQKFRYDLYIKILKTILPKSQKIKILDIGCALGDFTERVYKLDQKNDIIGIELSKNAIIKLKEKFPKTGIQIWILF